MRAVHPTPGPREEPGTDGALPALRGLLAGLVDDFEAGLRGVLLRPADPGFDCARRLWNGMVDRTPALVARCAGVADVIRSITFARDAGLEVSVRGTGHNAAGLAVTDGGLVIDLSAMKGIRVDPVRRTAQAQAGVTWGELDHETQMFGLAVTGGRISTTGIAGVTLGGGYGWLMRKCGLTIDNLRSADIVLSDGRLLHVSGTEHTDLFWGLRGGGGNFGVVTSLEYGLHAVGPTVTAGVVFYDVECAREILTGYRLHMASAPDDLATLCNLLIAPAAPFIPQDLRGRPVVAIPVCHTGSREQAHRDLAPLRELGRPLLDRIGPMPYTRLQRLFDASAPFGSMVHGRSGMLADLSDNAIDALVAHAGAMTSPLSIIMICPLGGALARVDEDATAFSHRRARFSFTINALWTDPRESAIHVNWTDAAWTAAMPYSSGVYVNELGNEGEARVREAYGRQTYQRLVALKDVYDPTNFFHMNQNIRPSNPRPASRA